MFNEILKTEFIQSEIRSQSRKDFAVRLFDWIEPFEVEYGDDICTFPQDVLKSALDSIASARSEGNNAKISVLRKYFAWCAERNIPGAVGNIEGLRISNAEKFRSCTVTSPKHLQRYLGICCAPESEQTIGDTIRCDHWLAYFGMPITDICNVRCGDVKLDRMLVVYNNREYEIYREAMQAFRNCATMTQFYHKNAYYKDGGHFRDRAPGDLLVRGFRAEDITPSWLRNIYSRAGKTVSKSGLMDVRLDYKHLRMSGLFYRMYEMEMCGVRPNFYPVAEQEYYESDKNECDTDPYMVDKSITTKKRYYQKDYELWKSLLTR